MSVHLIESALRASVLVSRSLCCRLTTAAPRSSAVGPSAQRKWTGAAHVGSIPLASMSSGAADDFKVRRQRCRCRHYGGRH